MRCLFSNAIKSNIWMFTNSRLLVFSKHIKYAVVRMSDRFRAMQLCWGKHCYALNAAKTWLNVAVFCLLEDFLHETAVQLNRNCQIGGKSFSSSHGIHCETEWVAMANVCPQVGQTPRTFEFKIVFSGWKATKWWWLLFDWVNSWKRTKLHWFLYRAHFRYKLFSLRAVRRAAFWNWKQRTFSAPPLSEAYGECCWCTDFFKYKHKPSADELEFSATCKSMSVEASIFPLSSCEFKSTQGYFCCNFPFDVTQYFNSLRMADLQLTDFRNKQSLNLFWNLWLVKFLKFLVCWSNTKALRKNAKSAKLKNR